MGSKSHKKKKSKGASAAKKTLPKRTRIIYEASTTDCGYTTSDAEGKEWAVDKIVDQAYDYSGHRRLKVCWAEWKRSNGTNTTWEEENGVVTKSAPKLLLKWNSHIEQTYAKRFAKSGPSILVGDSLREVNPADGDTHALDLLLKKRKAAWDRSLFDKSETYAGWKTELQQLDCEPGTAPSDDETLVKNLVQLRSWERDWNTRARKAHPAAAGIAFVNDEDDTLPNIPPNFKYLEAELTYGQGVDYHSQFPQEGFVVCLCSPTCQIGGGSTCDCQGPSLIPGSEYAYNIKGLFNFKNKCLNEDNQILKLDVIECNKFCACGPECPNRASQKARTIPVEIFKTKMRGWGVRFTKRVVRGQVLGFYTGEIVTRTWADTLLARRKKEVTELLNPAGYLFDLDGGEDIEDLDHTKYSVDAWNCGNWTRFINHSCSPNAEVYTAIVDSYPDVGLGRIVFVASKNIEAFTEITIDYNPDLKPKVSGKGKGKGKAKQEWQVGVTVEMDLRPCYCGAKNCREYFQLC